MSDKKPFIFSKKFKPFLKEVMATAEKFYAEEKPTELELMNSYVFSMAWRNTVQKWQANGRF